MDVTWSATVMPLPTLKKALLVNEKMAMSPSRLASAANFWNRSCCCSVMVWFGERVLEGSVGGRHAAAGGVMHDLLLMRLASGEDGDQAAFMEDSDTVSHP